MSFEFNKLIKNSAGFTFIESLIAFSIVGIFLALTWATVNFMLVKTNDQIVKTRAHFLAVEGIEIVKQIRQTAVNEDRENGFVSAIGSKEGEYVINKNSETFHLEEGAGEQITIDEEPYTTYCRTVQMTGDSETVKEVAVTVRWGDATNCNKGDKTIMYSTYLADLTH